MAEYKISQIDKDTLVRLWNDATKTNDQLVQEMAPTMGVSLTDDSEKSAVWRCIKKKISSSAALAELVKGVDRQGGFSGTHTVVATSTETASTSTETASTTTSNTTNTTSTDTDANDTDAPAVNVKFKMKVKGTTYTVEASDQFDAIDKVQQLMKNARLSKAIIQKTSNRQSVSPTELENGGDYEMVQQLSAADLI